MNTQNTFDSEERASEFILAEYATLRELRMSLDSLGESRMNFYLTAISGSVICLVENDLFHQRRCYCRAVLLWHDYVVCYNVPLRLLNTHVG